MNSHVLVSGVPLHLVLPEGSVRRHVSFERTVVIQLVFDSNHMVILLLVLLDAEHLLPVFSLLVLLVSYHVT